MVENTWSSCGKRTPVMLTSGNRGDLPIRFCSCDYIVKIFCFFLLKFCYAISGQLTVSSFLFNKARRLFLRNHIEEINIDDIESIPVLLCERVGGNIFGLLYRVSYPVCHLLQQRTVSLSVSASY